MNRRLQIFDRTGTGNDLQYLQTVPKAATLGCFDRTWCKDTKMNARSSSLHS
jgi:hypothetical protein